LMILSEFGRFGTGYGYIDYHRCNHDGSLFSPERKSNSFTLNGKEWVSISTHQLGSEEMIIDFINTFFETKSKLDNVTKPINPSRLISF